MKYSTNENTYIITYIPNALSVTISVYRLSDNTQTVTNAAMSQVATTGCYKYLFSAPAGEYLWVATDGVTVKMGKIVVGSDADRIDEIHKIHGLNSTQPLTVSDSARTVGTITQTITGGSSKTLTRI